MQMKIVSEVSPGIRSNGLQGLESFMMTTALSCIFWCRSHLDCHQWTWVTHINNVWSIKTILFDILDFWCQLKEIRFVKTLSKRCMFVSSWKFQRVDYYTAWSNSTNFVEKRDLPNHGQTCGHRFGDVIWRIPNPTFTLLNTDNVNFCMWSRPYREACRPSGPGREFFRILGSLLNPRSESFWILPVKVGLGISRTNADSQWNPVYNVFHRNFGCGNETIRR